MDKNTLLELEALKMEARATELREDYGIREKIDSLYGIAYAIRALKDVDQKEADAE